jgi:hypothetical protein
MIMTRFLTDYELRRRLLTYGRMILLVINACLLSGGLLLIGCSVWVLDEARGFVMNSFYSTSAILLTLSGLFCIILGMIGCSASQEKCTISLIMFICGLCLLLLLLLVTQVLAFIFSGALHTQFREWIHRSAKKYFQSNLVQDSWDVLQSRLRCCGITAPGNTTTGTSEASEVWQTNPEFRKENGPAVPESCCVSDLISSFQNYRQFRYQCQGQKSIIYRADCYERLLQFVKPKAQVIALTSLSMTLLLTMAIISALLVYQGMRIEANKRKQTGGKRETRRTTFVKSVRQRPISVSTLTSDNNEMLLGESAMTPVEQESVTENREPEKFAASERMPVVAGAQNQQTSKRSRIPAFQKLKQQKQQQVSLQQNADPGQDQWHLQHAVMFPRTEVAKASNMYRQEFSIRRAGNGVRRW